MTLKRVGAEVVGTFVIVFAPVALSGAGITGALEAALVSGLAVMAMVAAFGPISAAHFNPAVTLGFAVARRFPWRMAPAYWAAQFGGAILAAALAALMYGPGHGAHVPTTAYAVRNVGTEAAITFILMLVIIAVATDRRVPASTPPVAIGFAVVVGVLIGAKVTGGSMNPARSLGPALFAGGPALSNLWIYFVGPMAGSILAVVVYEFLRIHPEHACNAPGDLSEPATNLTLASPAASRRATL